MSQLLQMLVSQVDERTVNQLGAQLGLSPQNAQQAVGVALPMLVRALSGNASSPEGAESLTNALKTKHNGSILDDIAGALSKPETLNDGQAILGHVLGARKATVQQGLGKVSGLDENASGALLAALAPVVMGALGKVQGSQNLDANGVANLLQQERGETESNLGSLARLMDLDGDGEVTDDMMVIGSSLLGNLFGRR